MIDSTTYREFKLSVPIWDISDDNGDSEEMGTLFEILSVTPPTVSLDELYNSFREDKGANPYAGPHGRIGRGDVLIFLSSVDDESFIAIDMF